MRIEQPVANGLSTDHPVPGLPFVDDSHLPLQDGKGIERHGRHDHNPGWGRHDADRSQPERWTAFTDDQFNLTWAWGVRTEPGYGRTVLLYHSADATIMHTVQPRPGDPLAFRAGGYWWDGDQWYRPLVILDRSTDQDVASPVSDAATVSAADYTATQPGDRLQGTLLDITEFTPRVVSDKQWRHELAVWQAHRPADGLATDRCVVDVAAAELQPDALMSTSAAAREVGLSRAEVDTAIQDSGFGRAQRFPFPQAHTPRTGSPRWSRPVLRDWAWEHRRARPAPVIAHLQSEQSHPDSEALLYVLRKAVVHEIQGEPDLEIRLSLGLPFEKMIGWLLRAEPTLVEALFGDLTRELRETTDMADKNIAEMLTDATYAGLEFTPGPQPDDDHDTAVDEFLRRTLPPSIRNH